MHDTSADKKTEFLFNGFYFNFRSALKKTENSLTILIFVYKNSRYDEHYTLCNHLHWMNDYIKKQIQ